MQPWLHSHSRKRWALSLQISELHEYSACSATGLSDQIDAAASCRLTER